MTDKLLNLLLIKLKVLLVVLFIALISILTFSFSGSKQIAADIWVQLGMTKAQGMDGIRQSFLNGYLYYYSAKNARNIAVGNRGAIAKDLLLYTRQYISSEAFKKEYELMRRSAKPEAPENKEPNKEEIRKQKIAEMEKSLKESEKTATMNADMAKIMKPTIEMIKKTLDEYKQPNSKYIESFYQYEINENKRRVESYQQRMKEWEKEYPADYKQKIKDRLQKFLDTSATVDFTAELKQVGNKKKFVNPDYEGKSYDWKQIYRAGKEVIDPARKVAEEWINEINTTIKK